MTTAPAYGSYPVLADVLARPVTVPRRLAADAALVFAGAAVVAGAAQVAIPFWPVPLTMQTFAVLLVGTVLGPLRGALSLGFYLVLGVVGLPIFAGGESGSLFAMTSGGYIVGFVLAATAVGYLARRAWDRKVVGTLVSFLVGSALIYAVALPWLYFTLSGLGEAVWSGSMGYDSLLAATIGAGLIPFLAGDIVKGLLAAGLVPLAWRGTTALDQRARR